MKIAILSDIHGNLEALRAVLAEAEYLGAEEVFSLGDIVGYGPDPAACIDLVRRRAAASLRGNHDAAVVGATPIEHFNEFARWSIEWTAAALGPGELRYLEGLPLTAARDEVFLAHASPQEPGRWHYLYGPEDASPAFAHFAQVFCAVGHSHYPFIAVLGDDGTIVDASRGTGALPAGCRCLLNAGSVGQPRDRDPRSSYALLDTVRREVSIRRVAYPLERTQERMRRAGIPGFLVERLALGI